MAYVVKFLTEERIGYSLHRGYTNSEDDSWHLVFDTDAERAFCSGQVFGYGEADIKYKTKQGKVTCPKCIEMIKAIKAIKL